MSLFEIGHHQPLGSRASLASAFLSRIATALGQFSRRLEEETPAATEPRDKAPKYYLADMGVEVDF